MLPEKILLAADGSEDSKLALRMATSMAGGLGSELHVVYVAIVSPWVLGGKLSDTEYDRLRREQQGFLDSLVEEIKGMGGELAGSHFRVGKRADDEIIQ
ncbi:MAG: universal stress protein, partial [Actinomycetota bacterium]|nr:universal stress protein [Actinomycetota bacterium]